MHGKGICSWPNSRRLQLTFENDLPVSCLEAANYLWAMFVFISFIFWLSTFSTEYISPPVGSVYLLWGWCWLVLRVFPFKKYSLPPVLTLMCVHFFTVWFIRVVEPLQLAIDRGTMTTYPVHLFPAVFACLRLLHFGSYLELKSSLLLLCAGAA